MNLYFWIILLISVVALTFGAFRGYHRGFVRELESLVALICTVSAFVLISGLARGSLGTHVSTKALATALLIMLGALYSICRIIFASLRLFSGLPVIRFADSVLGVAAGVAKAFLLLYVVECILKIWLNL